MMKKFTCLLLAMTLVFASCSDDKKNTEPPKPKPYESGIIYYGTSHEDLAFYDPAKDKFYEGNIFENVNGESIGIDDGFNGGINSVYIYGGKAYFLTPITSEEGTNAGKARIAVTDANTFKLEKSIYADGFDVVSMGDGTNTANIYNMIVVNENKFYVTSNVADYPVSNISKISVIESDASGNASVTGTISGTSGALGVDGPHNAHLLRHNNYVIAGCGSKVVFINTTTDRIDAAKTIELDPSRQVLDVLKGRDGNIYCIVGGKITGSYPFPDSYTSTASVVKIDPVRYTYTSTDLFVDGEDVAIKGAYESTACASLTTDELFMMEATYPPSKIYSYNYTTGATTLFADVEFETGYSFSKYMTADKKGRLYVPTTNYVNVKPMVFDIPTKQRNMSVESKFNTTMMGDGGFVSTYIF